MAKVEKQRNFEKEQLSIWYYTIINKNFFKQTFDDDTRCRPPPPDVILPPLRPCMGGNPRLSCGLRLTPHCLPVCCHWLPAFKGFQRSQACDFCHTSFLRPLTAISYTASSIWGLRLLLILRGCILQVCSEVFVVAIGQMWSASMQGLQGGRMTSGFGVDTEYHHLVVQGCILGLWLCLCVSFVVVFLGHLFLVLGG